MKPLSIPHSDQHYRELLAKGAFNRAPGTDGMKSETGPNPHLGRNSVEFAENLGCLTSAVIQEAGFYDEASEVHKLTPEGAMLFEDIFYGCAKYMLSKQYRKASLDFVKVEIHLAALWEHNAELAQISESKKRMLHDAAIEHNRAVIKARL